MAGSEPLVRALKETVDGQNISFFDAARSAGYSKDQEDLSSVFMKKGSYSAFVELHIEQGPILEDEGMLVLTLEALLAIFLDRSSSLQFLILVNGKICHPGVSIGIVTAIAAPASIKVDFEGNGGHAGAVLMPSRFISISFLEQQNLHVLRQY